jgi:hypothetical protein
MTAQAVRPYRRAMTTTAIADSALATNCRSLAARSRSALIVVAAALALAGAGFAAARSVAEPGREHNVPVCSETCGPVSTTSPVITRSQEVNP